MLKLITIEVGQCMPSLVDGKLILTFFMQLVKKKNVDTYLGVEILVGVCLKI